MMPKFKYQPKEISNKSSKFIKKWIYSKNKQKKRKIILILTNIK